MHELRNFSKKVWRIVAALVLGLPLLIGGCGGGLWQSAPAVLEKPEWSVHVPSGWKRLKGSDDMLTKDGPYLNYIFLQQRSFQQRFAHTQRTIAPDMLPHEAADVIISSLQADPRLKGLQLLENAPVNLSGHDGFKLVFVYRDERDVEVKSLYYGIVLSRFFLSVRFCASRSHYFEEGLPDFMHLVDSLRIKTNRL